MKKSIKKSIYAFALIAAFGVALTSCNRGMGCPTFSLDTAITKMIHTVDSPTID